MNQPIQTQTAVNERADLQFYLSPIGWLLALLVPLYFYYFGGWQGHISEQAVYLIIILFSAVCMWVFRLLPDFVPSVFLLLGLLLLGAVPASVAFSGYSSQTFFMALSILSLSGVIIRSGLSERMMLFALNKGPKNKLLFPGIIFICGVLATPFIPTTNGRVSLIAPFMGVILKQIKKGSVEHERMASVLLAGLSLFSPIFISAKSINLLVWGMLSTQDQSVFNYSFWLFAALVPGAIVGILYLLALVLIFWNNETIEIDEEYLKSEYESLPKISSSEIMAMVGLGCFVTLIVTHSVHHISLSLAAFLIFFSLLFFNLLNKRQISDLIDWSFLIFLGALIGFANAMEYLHIDQLVASNLSWLNHYLQSDITVFILLLCSVVFIIRLFLPINTTVILLAGALMPTASLYGASPWLVGFIILMMSESFIWPYQASYYMQCESILGEDHREALTSKRVLTLNFLVFLIKTLALYLSIPYWKLLGIL